MTLVSELLKAKSSISNVKSHMENGKYSSLSGDLSGLVFRIEFECAGGDFAETFAAAQTDGEINWCWPRNS
jgi:hypothetical protein